MRTLYHVVIHIVQFLLKIVGWFHPKIKLFNSGRRATFEKLAVLKETDRVIWFHAASLGEFEQGRPILEQLKKDHPKHKIVVTFFSPSGYEIRKNYPLADVVCYLPFDTGRNVRKFVSQVHPDMAIIIKYEFWPNLLHELQRQQIKTILVSGIFRKEQPFFRWYGRWMQSSLQAFDHFFVQNETSKELLNSIGYTNVTISGDTRFDRVYEILQQDHYLEYIEAFTNNAYTVVAGSTWEEDEALLVPYINKYASPTQKFIIAPHKIDETHIAKLTTGITQKTVLFSERSDKDLSAYNVFIADTIGVLTKIYAYADIAYVGGGLATGLHNILEPATYGIPVIFGGHKYHKFQEAKDVIALQGGKTITTAKELNELLSALEKDKDLRTQMGTINKNYIQKHIGATSLIIEYINKQIN